MTSTQRRKAGWLFLIVGLTAMIVSPALAHPRRYRHDHKRRGVHLHVVVGAHRPMARPIIIGRTSMGSIDFNVEPEDTQVIVDGVYRGKVDDFDGIPSTLNLRPGRHTVTLKTPDGDTWSEKVRVKPGEEFEINLELEG